MTSAERSDKRLAGDRGFAAVELPIAVIALVLVMLLMIGGIRIAGTRGDVASAAHAGARAAANERTLPAASAAADRVAKATLAQSGVACPLPVVSTVGDLSAGLVTVTVVCTVALQDVALAGFPGSHTVTATGVERSDDLRMAP